MAGRDPAIHGPRFDFGFMGALMTAFRSAVALLALGAASLAGDAPKLGTPLAPDELAKWNITIFPDGRGLPKGRGTAKEGRAVYDKSCASCHGPGGRGATAEELAGSTAPLTSDPPDKIIGTYWPYATTIFDVTRRSMPMQAPGSLSDDEVYAVTAYLLWANKIVREDEEINERTLPLVRMPNRDGFDWIDAQ